MVGAKLANLPHGVRSDRSENFPILNPISQSAAADLLNVSDRSIRSAHGLYGHFSPWCPPYLFPLYIPRANLNASNDAASRLARFFQRTLFSSTANFILDYRVWFSTTATSRGLIVRAPKKPVPNLPIRRPVAVLDLAGFHPTREHMTRGICAAKPAIAAPVAWTRPAQYRPDSCPFLCEGFPIDL
jgi:hypothetical protein